MKYSNSSVRIIFVIGLQCYLSVICVAHDFDFFYFVQQWPGSFCDTNRSCCYPRTGKPAAEFGIHGLWPNYNNGSYPSNCDPNNPYNQSALADLTCRMETSWPSLACPSSNGSAFWSHEWGKHGTCSESILDQHEYFQAALDLKNKINLSEILRNAGIAPDGGVYSLSGISEALKRGIGYSVGIECNRGVDASSGNNTQLYQIYTCVDTSGSNIIECPVLPHTSTCASNVEFPSF